MVADAPRHRVGTVGQEHRRAVQKSDLRLGGIIPHEYGRGGPIGEEAVGDDLLRDVTVRVVQRAEFDCADQCCLARGGERLVSGGYDQTVRVWESDKSAAAALWRALDD